MWFEQMHPEWQLLLAHQKANLDSLEKQLSTLPNLAPKSELVMKAFETNPKDIKVVILGQDPYPTKGVAIGFAFAIAAKTPVPASLKNIAQELQTDVQIQLTDPTLAHWREQGVWLLNRALTTVEGMPSAHSKHAWHEFTTAAVQALSESQPLVFVLWGSHAQSIEKQIHLTKNNLRVIKSVHPSPLSAYRGFFGSKPFSSVNLALRELGQTEINW